MSAITAALSQIDRVAAEGDLAPDPAAPLELETAGDPILLPDGKRIYPPCLHGQPIDELALALLDMYEPALSTFLRLIGPPGAGKSQIARAIAYRLWNGRGREVAERHGPRSTGSSSCSRALRRTSSSSATTTFRSPGAADRSRWSTRRSCRRCARAGW